MGMEQWEGRCPWQRETQVKAKVNTVTGAMGQGGADLWNQQGLNPLTL